MYVASGAQGNSEGEAMRSSMRSLDANSVSLVVLSLWVFSNVFVFLRNNESWMCI